MIGLLRGAKIVATDSGGVQKEAYFHGTPVVILRDETEWAELVDLGWATLTPPDGAEAILGEVQRMEGQHGDTQKKPYGTGATATTIRDVLRASL